MREFLGLLRRDEAFEEAGEERNEGQEQDRVDDVETRVGCGDRYGDHLGELVFARRRRHRQAGWVVAGLEGDELIDTADVDGKNGGDPRDSDHVEENVRVGGALGVRGGADGGEDGGDGGADVLAEHQGRGGREWNDAGRGEADGDRQRRRGGLDDAGEQAADKGALEHAEIGVGGKPGKGIDELGHVAQGLEAVLHEFEAEKDHAQAHDRHAA